MAVLFICTETITFDAPGGGPVFIRQGSLVRANNPVLRRDPGAFAPLVLHLDYEPDLDETTVAVQVTGRRYEGGYGAELARVERVRTEGPAPVY